MRGGDPLADLRGIALGCVAAEQPAGQCRDELGQFRVHGGGRGDQFVTVRVVTPKNLTGEQKDLLRRLGESLGDSGVSPKKKSIFGGK